MALPTQISNCEIGHKMTDSTDKIRAEAPAMPSAFCRPRVRGATPQTTKATSVMISTVSHSRVPRPWKLSTSTKQTSTTEVTSQATRKNAAVVVSGAGSSVICLTAAAPRLPSATICSARVGVMLTKAVSTAEPTPASTAVSTAQPTMTQSRPVTVQPSIVATQR